MWEVCASILGQNISLINTECDSVICVSDILLNSPSAGCCCSNLTAALGVPWLLPAAVTVHCSDSVIGTVHTQLHNAPILCNIILISSISACVPLVNAVCTFLPVLQWCCSLKYLIFYLFPVNLTYDTFCFQSNSFLNKSENLKWITWMTNLALQHCVLLLCKK